MLGFLRYLQSRPWADDLMGEQSGAAEKAAPNGLGTGAEHIGRPLAAVPS